MSQELSKVIAEVIEKVKQEVGEDFDLSGVEIQIGSKPSPYVSDDKFIQLLEDAVEDLKDSEEREEPEDESSYEQELKNEGAMIALESLAKTIHKSRELINIVSEGSSDVAIQHIFNLLTDVINDIDSGETQI